MEKCNYHDRLEDNIAAMSDLVRSISDWRQVDEHRQNSTDKKLEKICEEVQNVQKWLTKLQTTMPERYGTKKDIDKLQKKVDDLRTEFDGKLTRGITISMGLVSLFATVLKFFL